LSLIKRQKLHLLHTRPLKSADPYKTDKFPFPSTQVGQNRTVRVAAVPHIERIGIAAFFPR
jgi:hypothetical protein